MIESKVAAEQFESGTSRDGLSIKARVVHGFATYASSLSVCLGRPLRSLRSMVSIAVLNEGVSAVFRGVTTVHTYRTLEE